MNILEGLNRRVEETENAARRAVAKVVASNGRCHPGTTDRRDLDLDGRIDALANPLHIMRRRADDGLRFDMSTHDINGTWGAMPDDEGLIGAHEADGYRIEISPNDDDSYLAIVHPPARKRRRR